MNINIKITGPAGMGMNSTADIISGIFSELGYFIAGDNEYQSIIKGGLNYFDLNISDTKVSLSKYSDIVLAFNDKNLENILPLLKKGGYIITNKKYNTKLEGKLDDFNVLDLDISDKYDNTYLLAILAKLLGLDENLMLEKVEKVFSRKGETVVKYNQAIITSIFKTYKIETFYKKIEKVGTPKKITFGNQALINGAAKGELEYYSAYPMTPASTLITEVIKHKEVVFFQGEDEVAVANSTLGASFTGKRSLCGTSGGGFALMTEALSFAVQAEIPITVVFSQRAGPSTGTPTFHEAGDLNFALNPTFGDFNHIVLYPSNLEEAYYFGCLALNLADKYQAVVILLMDKQSSEFHGTISKEEIPSVDRGIILDTPPEDYKRYELTESHISPRVNVGTVNGDFIATSYEHDEYGATTEDTKMKQRMTEKRFKKFDNFYEKESSIQGYEIINKGAKKMLIITSFTSYVVKDFVENNPEFGIIILKVLKPLDERLLNDIKDLQEIIFIENNYSGQLENYITKEFGLSAINSLKISHLRKYDLYPFYIEDFDALIKK